MDTGLDAGFEWIQDLMQDGLDTGLDAGFEQHHVQDEREGHSVGAVPTQRPKTKEEAVRTSTRFHDRRRR